MNSNVMATSPRTLPGMKTLDKVRKLPKSADFWGPRFLVVSVILWATGFALGFLSALTFMVILCWACLILGARQPALSLIGISMLCALDAPLRVFLLTGGLLRWNTLNYWLLLVMAGSILFLLRLRDIQSRIFQAFIILLGIECLATPDPMVGFQHVLNIMTIFGIIWYFARASSDPLGLYWVALIVSTTTALGSVLFYMQRLNLPHINPNAWAYFPATGVFAICLGFPSAVREKKGLMALAALAVANLVFVFLSGSRGDLLVTLVCMLFLLAKIPGLSRRAFLVGVAFIMAVTLSTQFTDLQDNSLHRIDKLFGSNDYSLTQRTSGRSDLALAAWYIFLDHPLGVGTGGFEDAWINLGYHEDISDYRRGQAAAAHSAWMKTIAENGFLGITLLICIVLSFPLMGIHKGRGELLSLGLLVAISLSMAFLSTEFQSKGLWFLTAGVLSIFHGEEYRQHLAGWIPPGSLLKANRVKAANHVR
ncbi:MAG: O-antigen ligase family protein [Chloroflexia bacterium]